MVTQFAQLLVSIQSCLLDLTDLFIGYVHDILRYYPRYIFAQRRSCEGPLVCPICCHACERQIIIEAVNQCYIPYHAMENTAKQNA